MAGRGRPRKKKTVDDFSSESESDSSSEEEEVAEEDTSEDEAEDLEEDYDDEDDDDLLEGADAPKTSKSFSTSGRQLKRYLAGCVLVPYRWSRRLTEDLDDRGPLVYYCSPSGRVLRSLDEVANYMSEPNACNCYLPGDLKLADSFDFDARVSGLALAPPPLALSYNGSSSRPQRRPRCLAWLDKVGGDWAAALRPRVERALLREVVTDQQEAVAIAGRSLGGGPTPAAALVRLHGQRFDWSEVHVLRDGRLYLRQTSASMWRHRLYEWKNSSLVCGPVLRTGPGLGHPKKTSTPPPRPAAALSPAKTPTSSSASKEKKKEEEEDEVWFTPEKKEEQEEEERKVSSTKKKVLTVKRRLWQGDEEDEDEEKEEEKEEEEVPAGDKRVLRSSANPVASPQKVQLLSPSKSLAASPAKQQSPTKQQTPPPPPPATPTKSSPLKSHRQSSPQPLVSPIKTRQSSSSPSPPAEPSLTTTIEKVNEDENGHSEDHSISNNARTNNKDQDCCVDEKVSKTQGENSDTEAEADEESFETLNSLYRKSCSQPAQTTSGGASGGGGDGSAGTVSTSQNVQQKPQQPQKPQHSTLRKTKRQRIILATITDDANFCDDDSDYCVDSSSDYSVTGKDKGKKGGGKERQQHGKRRKTTTTTSSNRSSSQFPHSQHLTRQSVRASKSPTPPPRPKRLTLLSSSPLLTSNNNNDYKIRSSNNRKRRAARLLLKSARSSGVIHEVIDISSDEGEAVGVVAQVISGDGSSPDEKKPSLPLPLPLASTSMKRSATSSTFSSSAAAAKETPKKKKKRRRIVLKI